MKDQRTATQILAEWGEPDLLEAEGGYRLNVFSTPLAKAREYAEGVFECAGKDLDEVLPGFDHNYKMLQQVGAKAKNVPRIKMPVIEPIDMDEFEKALSKGRLDIFRPYALGQLYVPDHMTHEEGANWVSLGLKDGKEIDDRIHALWTQRAVKTLLPTQKQIWLENVIGSIVKFGPPANGLPILNKTVIVSKEGYILDGHHRYGQCMLADPSLSLKALVVPLGIKRLLEIGRSYGAAIGNEPKGR